MAKRYGAYGLVGTGRRVRRRVVPLAQARRANRGLRLARRTKLLRRAGKWGLRGLAVGLAAKAVIGTARAIRKAKKTEVFKNAVVVDTRSLSNSSLTDITKIDTIDGRERHNIQLGGYRIKGEIRNKLASPLYVNIALLSNRDLGGGSAADEFFRHDGSVRSIDFSDALSAIEIHGNPINTDKFAILKHSRYRLNANAQDAIGTVQEGSGHHYMNIDWYHKINRNLQYDGDAGSSVDATSNIQLVYWCDEFGAAAGSPAIPTACEFNWKVVAYHHDS